jgi:phenylalanyl-tRNA synthetase alpha subunit
LTKAGAEWRALSAAQKLVYVARGALARLSHRLGIRTLANRRSAQRKKDMSAETFSKEVRNRFAHLGQHLQDRFTALHNSHQQSRKAKRAAKEKLDQKMRDIAKSDVLGGFLGAAPRMAAAR